MTEAARPVSPSSDEIKQLLAIAERDLCQAQMDNLHLDTRFSLAYNAALQLATAALRLHGIRIRKTGFHQQTLAELRTRLPTAMQGFADFFDRARRKRNAASYDRVNVVSEGEVDDLIDQVGTFRAWVDAEVRRRRGNTAEA